jgi:hypothetical protein
VNPLGPVDALLAAAPLGVSLLGWVIRIAIGLVAVVAIYVVLAGILAKFKIAPPEEIDPEDVVPVDVRFRCIVCGAEVTMTAAQDADEIEAPRHCREDMVRVGPRA